MNVRDVRKRFVDDSKLPIPVLEDPYFEFYLNLYEKEWKAKTDYERLVSIIEKKPEFFNRFYEIREAMIQWIKSKESFNRFNTCDIHALYGNPEFPNINSKSIYHEGNTDGYFVSLDLKKANLQALKYWDPDMFKGNTIDEAWSWWVKELCGGDEDLEWYIKKSKYIRQVVFGNCNPSRQIKLERWMVGNAAKEFITLFGLPEENVIFASSDEVVIKVDSYKEGLQEIADKVFDSTKVELRAQSFKLESVAYKNSTGSTVRLYKKIYSDGSIDFKDVPRHYFAQIYEDQNGINPDSEGKDMVFYQEKDIAKFVSRLCRS